MLKSQLELQGGKQVDFDITFPAGERWAVRDGSDFQNSKELAMTILSHQTNWGGQRDQLSIGLKRNNENTVLGSLGESYQPGGVRKGKLVFGAVTYSDAFYHFNLALPKPKNHVSIRYDDCVIEMWARFTDKTRIFRGRAPKTTTRTSDPIALLI